MKLQLKIRSLLLSIYAFFISWRICKHILHFYSKGMEVLAHFSFQLLATGSVVELVPESLPGPGGHGLPDPWQPNTAALQGRSPAQLRSGHLCRQQPEPGCLSSGPRTLHQRHWPAVSRRSLRAGRQLLPLRYWTVRRPGDHMGHQGGSRRGRLDWNVSPQ